MRRNRWRYSNDSARKGCAAKRRCREPMQPIIITVESAIEETPRVQQVLGLFDLPPMSHSRLTWQVDLPLHELPWHIGLIVGPSGCGKSTLARALWPDAVRHSSE